MSGLAAIPAVVPVEGSYDMNFWQWVLILLWWFLFFAYLVILFQILGDLFRDTKLSGWWKAVWIVCLVLFPFLTALVYVIARGSSMAERQAAAVRQAKHDTDSYIREVAGTKSAAEHIADAKALLDSGAITPEEFAQLKAKALA
ncbi:membrane protein [Cellulomonas gelida]|uniref:Membrane protein n=2 Tax=Cellulomonadaceae TaxID=85016 RepID=A0A4Y3KMQ5_9CELL|nr:membrane protein [Cellulomonas gelida]GGL21364.1 membrane protein [Cellulomonas gelida]